MTPVFQMSAITVGTLDAYKHSVESTCEAVDASIKVWNMLITSTGTSRKMKSSIDSTEMFAL